MQDSPRTVLACAAVLFAALLACKSGKKSDPVDSTRSAAPSAEPKSKPTVCAIEIPGSSQRVPAFPTEAGHDEFGKAAAQGVDDAALMVVVRANDGMLIEPGTRCIFMDVGLATTQVRISEPPFEGRAVWLPTEWTSGTPRLAIGSAVERKGGGEWKPGPDIVALEQIIAGKMKPTSVDRSGTRLTVSFYDVPGWSLATRAVRKDNPKAWSIQLGGDTCDPSALGEKVTLRGRDSATWYAVNGGPLAGKIVKAFEADKPCAFHIATVEYVVAEKWKPPIRQEHAAGP